MQTTFDGVRTGPLQKVDGFADEGGLRREIEMTHTAERDTLCVRQAGEEA
jgi:hypothetical protein